MELSDQIFHANAHQCRGCEHRRLPENGIMPCAISGHDTFDHCGTSYCPHPSGPRFGTAIEPDGWESGNLDIAAYGKPPPPPIPIPRANWPYHITALAMLATPTDSGIGDVIKRLADRIPAPVLAMMKAAKMAWTGESTCQCEAQRILMNQTYPLR